MERQSTRGQGAHAQPMREQVAYEQRPYGKVTQEKRDRERQSHSRSHSLAAKRSGRTQTTLVGRILLAIYFAVVVALALVALSVIRQGAVETTENVSHGFVISGMQDKLSGDFEGAVEVEFASGAKYLGAITETGFTGVGTYNGSGGWSISGEFTAGYLEGDGVYTDAYGTYSGAFVRSAPNGIGMYTSNEGWIYSGDFLGGTVTGAGKLVFADGRELEGTFENGIFQG